MHQAIQAHLRTIALFGATLVTCRSATFGNVSLLDAVHTGSMTGPLNHSLNTIAPKNESFAPTDSNKCLSTWLSLIKDIFITENLPPCPKTRFTVTSTSTITRPVSRECDGLPRVESVGEIVITSIIDRDSLKSCPSPEPKLFDNNDHPLQFDVPNTFPSCRISPSECVEQWNRLKAIAKDKNHWVFQRPNNQYHWYPHIFRMSEWNAHPFEQCPTILPYLRHECLHQYGKEEHLTELPPNELHRQQERAYEARVDVERFVLLHFPPNIPKSRDLCTSSGYGEFFDYFYNNKPGTSSATVREITFDAHDLRLGEDNLILTPNPTKSTWTGNWVFTSPNVYLALNTMFVRRTCAQTKTYTNRILTVHPHNLSSMVAGCSALVGDVDNVQYCTYTVRQFNFADLTGAIPAKAYFASTDSNLYPFNGKNIGTIVHGNHWPTISIPKAITLVDPELFATVDVHFGYSGFNPYYNYTFISIYPGVWDPPVTLQAIPSSTPSPTISSVAPDPSIPTAFPGAVLSVPDITSLPLSRPSGESDDSKAQSGAHGNSEFSPSRTRPGINGNYVAQIFKRPSDSPPLSRPSSLQPGIIRESGVSKADSDDNNNSKFSSSQTRPDSVGTYAAQIFKKPSESNGKANHYPPNSPKVYFGSGSFQARRVDGQWIYLVTCVALSLAFR